MSTEQADVVIAGDPYAVPERRKPSDGTHLVNGVRAAVDAWRAQGYPGASATTRRLLGYWFDDEHRTPDGAPFRFYFCQREAVETFIYLAEIEQVRSFRDLLDYAVQGILVQPGDTQRQRPTATSSHWRLRCTGESPSSTAAPVTSPITGVFTIPSVTAWASG